MACVRELSIFCCPRFLARARPRVRLIDFFLALVEAFVREDVDFGVLVWPKQTPASNSKPKIATDRFFQLTGRRNADSTPNRLLAANTRRGDTET